MKQTRFSRFLPASSKNAIRTITGHAARFLAVFAIIALGSGVFSGLRVFVPDMYRSADVLYDDKNLIDIRVTSKLGLTADDLNAIKSLHEVEGATGVHLAEVAMTSQKSSLEVSLEGIDLTALGHDERADYVNHLTLLEGRYPTNDHEIVISNTHNNISLGETLTVNSVIGFDQPQDYLKTQQFTVVGFVISPEYISDSYGVSPTSGTTITNYAYVSHDAFKDPNIYSDVFLTLKGAKETQAFSEEYKQAIEPGREALKKLARIREPLRRQALVDEAQAKIDDAQAELDDAKKTANDKIADAQRKLDEGRKTLNQKRSELLDGRARYEQGLIDYKNGKAEAERKLEEGREELARAAAQLDAQADQVEQARATLSSLKEKKKQAEASRDQIEQGLAALSRLDELTHQREELTAQKAALEKSVEQLSAHKSQLVASRDALGDPTHFTDAQKAQYAQLTAQIEVVDGQLSQAQAGLQQAIAGLSAVEDGINQITAQHLDKAQLEASYQQVQAGLAQLDDGINQAEQGIAAYESGKRQLDAGYAELAEQERAAQKQLEDAHAQLEASKAKLEEGTKQIAQAEQELEQGARELKDQKQQAEEKIASHQKEIDDAKEKLNDIPHAPWYILQRSANPAYAKYEANAQRMEQITNIFPLFFFLVAALVTLITMTRMVESERIEIGTLKALGYSRARIAAKYLIFAGGASIFGSLLGIAAGVHILPLVIWKSYSAMYTHLPFLIEVHPKDCIIAFVVCCVLALGSTALAARITLAETPSLLMLPRAPKPGKRILLERISPIWSHLSFTSKVTARNLFRYKKRLIMTVLGVAGCTALLLTGYGIEDSLGSFVPRHYYEINTFNEQIGLDTKADKDAAHGSMESSVAKTMQEHSRAAWAFFANTAAIAQNPEADPNKSPYSVGGETARTGGSIASQLREAKSSADDTTHEKGTLRDVTITVPHEGPHADQTLLTYFNLRPSYHAPDQLHLKTGSVIITQKLAEHLQLHVGDNLVLSHSGDDEGDDKTAPVSVPISGIAHYYVGHLVFMDAQTYKQLFGEDPTYNIIFAKGPSDLYERQEIAHTLKENPAISSVGFPEEYSSTYTDLTSNLGMLVVVIIFVSGSLALIVMYNLTNINIEERRSEIATIKVLGFFNREVDAYIFRETFFLSVVGIAVGLPLGVALCTFIMRSAELDDVMFVRTIEPSSYVYAILITLFFTCMVAALMHLKLKRIDMVSSLKAVD